MKLFIKDKVPFPVAVASLLLAFFVDIRAVNWTLVYGYSFNEGLMNLLYPICIVFVVFACIMQRFQPQMRRTNKESFFLILYLLSYYFFTETFIGSPKIPLVMFGVSTVFAFLLPQVICVSVPLFLKATMVLPFFAIFHLDSVFVSIVDWDRQLSMDTTYAFLIPVVANIVYLAMFFKEERFMMRCVSLFFSMINFVFFMLMLRYGSRGPLVCVALLLVWLYIFDRKESIVVINRKKLFIALLILCGIVVFGITLLSFLDSFLKSRNFEVGAIQKILSLHAGGDISNGRSDINTITIARILDRPLFGWGLDRYDANTGLEYPHNFLLQTMYDGGLLLFFVLYIPIVKSLKKIIRNLDVYNYSYLSAVFFASVPGALFSQNLWAIPVLWVCFGAIISMSVYSVK